MEEERTMSNPQSRELQIMDRSEGTVVSGADIKIAEKPL